MLLIMIRRFPMKSLMQNSISLSRPYSSSSSSNSKDDDQTKERDSDTNTNDENQEEATVASMIGPYVSSKQIAFHTDQFDSDKFRKKNKQAFLDVVEAYKIQFPNRRGHVEFIRAALRRMKDFGVERDVECYKKLLSVFPIGPYRHQSMLQVSVRFWPKQNETASAIVTAMEDQGIPPDLEVVHMLREIFGPWAHPVRRFARLLYWAPKFTHKNPYPVPWELPKDDRALARLALERMTSTVDMETKLIDIHSTTDGPTDVEIPVEHNSWLIYTLSPRQVKIASSLSAEQPVYIEGPFGVYLRKKQLQYYVLKSNPSSDYWEQKKKLESFNIDDVSKLRSPFQPGATLYIPPSAHELDDGFVLSLCIIGKANLSLVNCWLYHLKRHHMSSLSRVSIVDRTKLTEQKITDRFYSSHLLNTPEFIIHHDTKRVAEEPRPWWYREKTDDEND